MKSKLMIALTLVLALCLASSSALACTAIYVGGNLTADGSAMFARSEDYSNSYAKVMYVSPAGEYKAGETYYGCYGFSYVWTKDSYSFTTFSDENGAAVDYECPNCWHPDMECGESHKHAPYGAAGTNEMGVSISATETLYTSSPVYDLDPYTDLGIEEAEITTVILSQAATAKEGVELLLSIYDEVGCNNGSGIFIADHNEIWYIENVTGTQYVAVKLNDDVAFAQPNQSVIGLIDLDDTENVIASANLIALAKQAGTFVGDEAANTIDYVASYNGDQVASQRMIDALTFFDPAVDPDNIVNADYTISNVDAEGNIVPFYGNIKLDHLYTVADIVDYYHIPSIGKAGNTEVHIFQIFDEDSLTDTVEWVAMDHGGYSPFVPFYPMLTKDTYDAYKTSAVFASFVEEEPAEGLYYPTTTTKRVDGQRVTVEGFKVLPANWADSMYWTMDAMSNLIESGVATGGEVVVANKVLAELQNKCYQAYEDLKAAAQGENAADACTEISEKIAEEVHKACVELVNNMK